MIRKEVVIAYSEVPQYSPGMTEGNYKNLSHQCPGQEPDYHLNTN
jgi:hypothetical protein